MSTLLPSGVCGITPPTGRQHQPATPAAAVTTAGGVAAAVAGGSKPGANQAAEFDPQKYERPSMKQDEIVALKRLFDACDVENSGVIFLKDLKLRMQLRQALSFTLPCFLYHLTLALERFDGTVVTLLHTQENAGYESRSDVITDMVNYFDRDGRTSLNFGQFLDLLTTDAAPFKTAEDITRTFQQFDAENAKALTQKMLTKAAKEFNMLPHLDIVEIIKRADTDGDGKISEREFHYIMEKQTFP